MSKHRKGISPLIAAVLLIAFTMAVASLFAQWAPELFEDAAGDTSERASAIQDCSAIQLDIINVNDDGDVTVQQVAGEAGAGEISVTWFYEDSDPAQETETLGGEDLEDSRDAVQLENPNGSALDSVEVSPLDCEGAAGASYNVE